jgi:CRISPR-associated protein Csb2
MPTAISITFLNGQFHATPWNHQVNEGVVEWPPSPWRILRALVAAAYALPEPPQRQELQRLMELFSQSLPTYYLPPSNIAHTRHYMPVWREGKATSSKVFDTFRVMEKGAKAIAVWQDLALDTESWQLLERLCKQVNYLGRSESWVQLAPLQEIDQETLEEKSVVAEVAPSPAAPRLRSGLAPQSGSGGTPQVGSGVDLGNTTEVLAPLTPEGLVQFRQGLETAGLMPPKPKKGKKPKWTVPETILAALELNVADLHAQGWNGIPGARWVDYCWRGDSQSSSAVPTRGEARDEELPTFARYALVSKVLPKLTESLYVGDRVRAILKKLSQNGENGPESVFSGRNDSGKPLDKDHQHAYFLPEDSDGDGRIDHLIVYARKGFSQNAVKALARFNRLDQVSGVPLQLVLVELGKVEQYCSNIDSLDTEGRSLLVGKSRRWRSMTPMVLPRHPKTYRTGEPKMDPNTGLQKDGPQDQVRKLLKYHGFDEPTEVRPIDGAEACERYSYPWWQFRRWRQRGKGRRGRDVAYGFELVFENRQSGPMALGYAAHFGLGIFMPVPDGCDDG